MRQNEEPGFLYLKHDDDNDDDDEDICKTFESICMTARCFDPRPFGSAAPRLSSTIEQ